MSLGIGGAETHIVSLSKGLKARGHEVVVASNGGVYEKVLSENDIKSVQVPMHSKHPICIIKSLWRLRKIISKYRPQVVHAHARIPALYVSLLSHFYDFKMITTVHGTFKVDPILKRITKWGKHVFSVSPDITAYLNHNYDMSGSIIKETINGIDLEIFKAREIKPAENTIVHVSRLEETTSKTASFLIDYAIKHGRKLIIYGGGSSLESLRIKAEGYENIQLPGAIDHVEEALKNAQVFVGISRAALEAMAMNLPVILAGDYGFVGLLDEKKAQESMIHNFTARGQNPLSYEKIESSLEKYFSKESDNFTWSRKFIEENYSLNRMVSDYLEEYKDKKDVFVIGYYGSNNLGDELLLHETLKLLESYFDRNHLTVLSYSMKDTTKIHGVKSVSRNNFFKIMKTIRKSDIVIGGGGSMLQNVTSNRSLFYYLWLLNYSTFNKKVVALIGNGIGPIHGELQTKLAKNILKKLSYIHLRDKKSFEWLKAQNVTSIDSGTDLALNQAGPLEKKWGKNVFINIRKWPNTLHLKSLMRTFKVYLEDAGYQVTFISMQKGNDDVAMTGLKNVRNFETPEALMQVIKTGDFMIGMRLHFLILAANYGIPFIGLSYDPKVSYFCDLFNQTYFDNLEKLTLEDLIEAFEKLSDEKQKNHEKIVNNHQILSIKNEGIHKFLKDIS
jgi:polysaccharide pyruvyl transferase CsaB